MNFHRLLTFLALLAISGCGNGGDNVSSAIGGGNVSAVDGGGLTSAVTPTANIPIVLPSGANGRQILGTRGFARVQADEFNTNKEAQTQFRVEFPYGASSGWKAAYQGYTQAFNIPNVTDSIVILAAAAWVQQSPGAAISKYRITFGGTKSVTIAYNAVVETDPISAALLPGARVWFTQWYKCDNPATGLPYGANLYFKEFEGPATESNDGSLVGAVGSLTDHTVSGGFNHVNNSLNLRDYVARGYHPMCVTGYPHPSYTGPGIAPFFVGDSITAFFDDLGEDGTQWAMRGWQGKFCKDIYPYVSYGIPSGTSGAFVTNFSRSNTFKYLLGVSGGATRVVTHMVNTYGINEIRFTYDAALTWRNRLDIAAIAHDYGISYIHSTLTPCGSRMVYASEKPGVITAFVAARKAFNDQVRAQSDDAHIPGCIGFIDPDTLLEVDYINSNNVWTDGSFEDPQATAIHPNPPGHKRYAAKIAASLFTNHPNPVPRPSR